LEREAFAQIARGDPGRVERLDDAQHALDFIERQPEPIGDLVERLRNIARFVDQIDDLAGERHVARRQHFARLAEQMIVQRGRIGRKRIEIGAVLGCRPADPIHAELAAQRAAAHVDRAVVVEGLGIVIDVERRIDRGIAMLDQPIGRDDIPLGHHFGCGRLGLGRRPIVGAGGEQGVLVELLGEHAFELEVGERQQLDRLLELRGHHQRLRLAQIEAGRETHRTLEPDGLTPKRFALRRQI